MTLKFKILATMLCLLLLCTTVHASTTVVLTSDNEADLAVANVLADTIGAKVIVTPWGTLSDDAIAEIEASGATEVYVIGGEIAVPDVEEKIKITVKRFAGKDRYETSALVAKRMEKEKHDMCKNNSSSRCPVVFVKPDEVPEEVEQVLDELNVNTVVIEAPMQERAQEAIDKAKEVIAEAEETFRKEVYKREERIKTKGIEEVKEEICENAEKFGVEEMKLKIQKQVQIKKSKQSGRVLAGRETR